MVKKKMETETERVVIVVSVFIFRQENGDAPLHIAARKGNVEICRLLVQSGAKTDAKNVRVFFTLVC